MKKVILVICFVLLACALFAFGKHEVVSEVSETVGKVYSIRVACTSEYRAMALIEAAAILNGQLQAEGSKDSVMVEYIASDDLISDIEIWAQEGNIPEILSTTSSTLFKFLEDGYVVDASYVVNDEVYSEKVPQNIRDMALANNGEYSSVVMDTECRVVTVYKPALVSLGWSDQQIEQWKQDARDGKVTVSDFQNLAKSIVDAGICEYGFVMTPFKNADWRFVFVTWCHGDMPLDENGNLKIDRQGMIDFFSFYRDSARMGLIPANWMTDYSTAQAYMAIGTGNAFSYMGHIEIKTRMRSTCNLTGEYIDENYFTIPYPVSTLGDRPVSGCNPFVIGLSTTSQASPELSEYCRRLLDCILDNEIQLDLSVRTTHTAITTENMNDPEYLADGYMSDLSYLTEREYIFCLPYSSDLSWYGGSDQFYAGVREAMTTALDPNARSIETIVDETISKIISNLKGGYSII